MLKYSTLKLFPCIALAFLLTVFSVRGKVLAYESSESEGKITDKTLVVWSSPSILSQRGGSALTINDITIDRFDGIVFAELNPKVWMPGSNNHSRTHQEQQGWEKETADPNEFVQIAIVYEGKEVTVYRNSEQYASYTMSGEPYTFTDNNTAILMGPRHIGIDDYFKGRIKDARIYDKPLNKATIASMKPGKSTDIKPWAWWDFSNTGTYEKTGRFNSVQLLGGAKVKDGALVLLGDGAKMFATIENDSFVPIPSNWSKEDPMVPEPVVRSSRLLREKLLSDPYRPGYHFCPPEGNGMPGDANGCFFANGRYHLMYLYERPGVGFSWGHISSLDLVHWRHHPDSIGPGNGDVGCFSGGGFVDDNGVAYLSYWMLWGAKGIGIAKSDDRHYSNWEKLKSNPVIQSTEWGITEKTKNSGDKIIYGSADPSNIWKKDGKYYMVTGNLLVLKKYGLKPDSPEDMKGDRVYLFESEDLKDWKYKGIFYERNPEWTYDDEDNMCPSFLPLPSSPVGGKPSGKYLLLFISHNKGCQYYIGDYDKKNDQFIPTNHGRMTWVDNDYFAPEALIDDQGRQIMWAWLKDNPEDEYKRKGWSGVYGLPRSLWVSDDGTLRMRPVKELQKLRYNEKKWSNISLSSGKTKKLKGVVGDSCELEIVFNNITSDQIGVKVRKSPNGEEETLLYYDRNKKELVFDPTESGIDGWLNIERAPLELKRDEKLKLRVFVDKSVIEIYANDRQAICRRVYPGRSDSLGVELFSKGGKAKIESVKAWEMMPSNPY
ncbi:GH32 C-terminal domain-containing protein [Sedimentisphaera salicampi]|uniref:GH32 C-terminal domain-containing protein n=1 Tax=Sedimentisphaera salicampi TaxID=1941349 RepID=UPI000B9BDC76|nr:GH32 C-terminal domain-containing protein [Sedimentisphaera salicampi]OXU15517.1 Sucrose-6-phosphate hydrolase [Sedimentisphaera salicampi]